jgi:hypothetical protein
MNPYSGFLVLHCKYSDIFVAAKKNFTNKCYIPAYLDLCQARACAS